RLSVVEYLKEERRTKTRPYDEEDDLQVLIKKAEKFELKELEKIVANRENLLILERLLNNAYVIRRPTPNEYEQRKQLIRVFNDIAKELYGYSANFPVVEEFGSFSMDLFTSDSDLDLSVNFRSSSTVFPRDQQIKTLRKFSRKFYALQNGGHVRGVQPILHAKVPILKVIDAGTGVECDLSVENRDGISKSAIIRYITSIDERFPKLSFLMKAWAKAHDINSSKDRTLNSLSLILLVAFHLQTRDPPILPPFSAILKDGEDVASVKKSVKNFQNYGRRNTETLGELFVSLLIKLASVEKLWPKGLCASPYLGHWTSKTWNTKIANMSVEDFTDQTQNVSRAVGKLEMEEIYDCIKLTVQSLGFFMDGQIDELKLKETLFGTDKIHYTPIPLVPEILKENHETNQHVTHKHPILNPNGVMDLRAAPNWSTSQLPTVYWGGTHHQAMITGPKHLRAELPYEHRPVKRMRTAEVVPATPGWRPALGGPRWGQGGGGAPTGGWGGTHGAGSQGMQPADDPWGRWMQPPHNGSSSTYGRSYR
nr:protein HESO1-like isoform X3 [Tanacetum cinerariifolium]